MNTEYKSFVPFNEISRERCYLLSEGLYLGRLIKAVWSPNKYGKLNAELSFEVFGALKSGLQHMARAVYLESEIDRLKEHLASWRGTEFLEQAIKEGGVDLKPLEGKLATIKIAHDEKRSGYEEVLRRVVGLFPPEVLREKQLGFSSPSYP